MVSETTVGDRHGGRDAGMAHSHLQQQHQLWSTGASKRSRTCTRTSVCENTDALPGPQPLILMEKLSWRGN
ncbi:hypothetical protein AV530_008203 [Patagioenas fasciata monilis]|uniref:Uncharacterized protein n=1 Tax=Patagioenas fasciata monilis TaxID=372326 RepID=A0A1V4KUW6_PATFA|nr:hypothetical protein AV530_008203 [Patagioenas fasciata monilis]